MVPSRAATTVTMSRTRGRISSTQRPSEVAISTRWSESPYTAVTCRTSPANDRAASSASRTHATFSAELADAASRIAACTTGGSIVVRFTTWPGSSLTEAAAAAAAWSNESRSRRFEYA
jgi:hypothetical protein